MREGKTGVHLDRFAALLYRLVWEASDKKKLGEISIYYRGNRIQIYNIAVQTPQYRIDSLDAIDRIPVCPGRAEHATGSQSDDDDAARGACDRQSLQRPARDRYLRKRAGPRFRWSCRGCREDHGASRAASASRKPPLTRGQVVTMRSSFAGLYVRLGIAIALVCLLLVVNFQSWTEAFIIITVLPGVLAGICWVLLLLTPR